jgi:uncharacterized protein (DUF2384 family)
MKTQDMVRELLEVTERFNKTASPQIDRDRISHATNIIHLASKIFDDSSQQWLNQPHKMLDDRVPLDIIDRDEGLRQTEDLLEKMAEIVDRAIKVFNNESVAKNWLRTPNPYLGDLIPLNMLESAEGIEHVLDMLGRIDYGVYS